MEGGGGRCIACWPNTAALSGWRMAYIFVGPGGGYWSRSKDITVRVYFLNQSPYML